MERLFSGWKIGLQDFVKDGRLLQLFFCLLLADTKDDSAEILRGFGLVDAREGYKEPTYALQLQEFLKRRVHILNHAVRQAVQKLYMVSETVLTTGSVQIYIQV